MEELTGKVAVVTGAASGIGRALAVACAAEGMQIVAADVDEAGLASLVEELGTSAEIATQHCDVSDPAQVDALRDLTVDRFGTAHLVCNNAGVSAGGPVWMHPPEDWNWVLGVNLLGVANGLRSFTPLLIEQGEGHIVNTASMAGLVSGAFMGIYNASKQAVVAISETLRADLAMTGATGVGVSVLCPGWVNTQIHTADRNRPGGADTTTPEAAGFRAIVGDLLANGLDPAHVASLVLDAVRTDRFYVLTHPEWQPMLEDRFGRILAGENPATATLPT